jgi:hypothetical protein
MKYSIKNAAYNAAFFCYIIFTSEIIPKRSVLLMKEFLNKKYTNRLIYEKSPYLLQHAHNPVDWFPWSPEAFQRAKREGKPVFLSIGYS